MRDEAKLRMKGFFWQSATQFGVEARLVDVRSSSHPEDFARAVAQASTWRLVERFWKSTARLRGEVS